MVNKTASKNPAGGVKETRLKSGGNQLTTFPFANSKLDLWQEC
jgi:hypothetical protein